MVHRFQIKVYYNGAAKAVAEIIIKILNTFMH